MVDTQAFYYTVISLNPAWGCQQNQKPVSGGTYCKKYKIKARLIAMRPLQCIETHLNNNITYLIHYVVIFTVTLYTVTLMFT